MKTELGMCSCGFVFPSGCYNIDCPNCGENGDNVLVDRSVAEKWGYVFCWDKYVELLEEKEAATNGYWMCGGCGHAERAPDGVGCLYCDG